jgi:hypothetical protein
VSSFLAERVRKASTKQLHHLESRETFAASCEPPQGQSSDIVSRNWLSIEAIEQSGDVRNGSNRDRRAWCPLRMMSGVA